MAHHRADFANNTYRTSNKSVDDSISSFGFVGAKSCNFTLYQHRNYKGSHTTWRGKSTSKKTRPIVDKALSNNRVGDNRASSYAMKCS